MLGGDAAARAAETQRWIAPVFPESKAMKRTAGPKSCFAVHSSAAALRWARLPRKFHRLNACRTAKFLVPRAALPRSARNQHERSSRHRIGPPRASIGRYRRRDAAADGGA